MNSSHNTPPNHDLLDEVELLDEPGGDRVRIRFNAPFEGKEIRWNAELFTATGWAREYGEEEPQQNIIDINAHEGSEYLLRLCLKVTCIDRPTLRKAVMMIRQYKRLSRGRHLHG